MCFALHVNLFLVVLDSLISPLFQIASLVLDGFTGVTQSRMKAGHSTKSYDMMLNMNLWSLLWLTIALLMGEAYDFALFAQRNPHVMFNILAFGMTSALGQVYT